MIRKYLKQLSDEFKRTTSPQHTLKQLPKISTTIATLKIFIHFYFADPKYAPFVRR